MKIRKHSFINLIALTLLVGVSLVVCKNERGLSLVKDGEASSVIILPEEANRLQRLAVDDFVRTVKLSTGAEIPVIGARDIAKVQPGKTKIILGPSSLTAGLGFPGEGLNDEEFRIVNLNNELIILAGDIIHDQAPDNIWFQEEAENSRVTQWALGYILDRYLGVRWLWPGELGTYIPECKDLFVPEMDVVFQQPLVRRCFNVIESNPENLLWLNYHQMAGERQAYRFRHSFREVGDNGDWFEEFRDTHPEYLAKDPNGMPGLVNGRDEFYKLCISNPDVATEIISRWEAAGMPDFWDITPNDGSGFCGCENCRALDREYGEVDYSPEELWNRPDHVFLTDRYAWFWNQLIRQMKEKNPEVKVGVFLYSAYRNPPKKLKLEEGIVGEIVHGFDFSYWKAWQEAGVEEIGLRPNWLYMGGSAPHLLLQRVGSYVENARDHGMSLIDMDCFHEYWATQGPYYYMISRMIARPDLGYEDVLEEYCQAFGEAAPEIRNYLRYWEDYTEKAAFNIPAGGRLSLDPDGLYETRSKEHFGTVLHPLKGGWMMMPYIYTPEVLDGGYTILDRAENLTTDSQTRKRIEFLRDGLHMVERASAYMSAPENEKKDYLEDLEDFGQDMDEKYGYWKSKDVFFLRYWGLAEKEVDTRGM